MHGKYTIEGVVSYYLYIAQDPVLILYWITDSGVLVECAYTVIGRPNDDRFGRKGRPNLTQRLKTPETRTLPFFPRSKLKSVPCPESLSSCAHGVRRRVDVFYTFCLVAARKSFKRRVIYRTTITRATRTRGGRKTRECSESQFRNCFIKWQVSQTAPGRSYTVVVSYFYTCGRKRPFPADWRLRTLLTSDRLRIEFFFHERRTMSSEQP